ncbi:cyclic nucleotide-binding domain-containing protein 1 isoform X1 [Rhincodon typus]|uniref:cyclic nucleotide-binding domain-containing protein 1 isoform X1 n=1 Tax=Rhincodon typus TaxID=259920 RepID=UPI00202E3DC3|nr:cyclic nucleotide-binding domain-containing protein 1 isoform X1 [Rhincodon typus]
MSAPASAAPRSWSRSDQTPGFQFFAGIDYHNLDKLCNICGLQSRENRYTKPEAHLTFMHLYRSIFLQPKRLLPKIPELTMSTLHQNSNTRELVNKDQDYLNKLLDEKNMEDVPKHIQKKVKILMKILKKPPFHRTRAEHLNTYKILKIFTAINTQFTDEELKNLSAQIVMESWARGYTVYGNQSFYMIVKGCAKPYTKLNDAFQLVYLDSLSEATQTMLTCGDSFGDLVPIPSQKTNENILSVVTEDRCEIVKISTGQYEHVKRDLMQRDVLVKEELIQACPFYQQWPKLSLHKLVALIKWKQFPENYVLVKEGEISSFAGFIKSGYCYIFKDIEVLVKLPLGNMQSEVKHIIMGKIQEKESFGEISIILNKPFTCTIITATKVELGVISASDLRELDQVNQILLQQTAEPVLGSLTQEEVNNRYIALEKEKEWQQFKQKVIKETMFYKGIHPNTGKWKHDWNKKEHSKRDVSQSVENDSRIQSLEQLGGSQLPSYH